MHGTKKILKRFKLIEKVDGSIDNFFIWILKKRYNASTMGSIGGKYKYFPWHRFLKKDIFLDSIYTNWKNFRVTQMELFENPMQDKLILELDEYINNRSEIIEKSAKVIEEYNLINRDAETFESSVFEIPEQLLTAFHQYFLFYTEYLISAKGIDIKFDVNRVPNGLFFKFNVNENISDKVQKYLLEYIEFIKTNDFSLIKVEGNPSPNEIDFLRLRLEQQVNMLQTEIKYKDLLINKLETENREIRKRNDELMDRLLKSFEGLSKKILKVEEESNIEGIKVKKNICKKYLRTNKLNELFSYLLFELTPKHQFEHELILLENQFRRMEKEKISGTLVFEEEMRIHNKIIMSLTQIIEQI